MSTNDRIAESSKEKIIANTDISSIDIYQVKIVLTTFNMGNAQCDDLFHILNSNPDAEIIVFGVQESTYNTRRSSKAGAVPPLNSADIQNALSSDAHDGNIQDAEKKEVGSEPVLVPHKHASASHSQGDISRGLNYMQSHLELAIEKCLGNSYYLVIYSYYSH